MKKQLLVLTALLALFASNSVAMLNLQPLDSNKLLEAKQLTQDVKQIWNQTLIPGKTGVYNPPVNAGDIEKFVSGIKSASLINLKNEAIASSTLKELYMSTIDQLDAQIDKANLNAKEVDLLTAALTRLYFGDSANTIMNNPMPGGKPLPGFKEGPVGRLFAFIANSANVIQTLHTHLEPLLPADGIAAHGGGVMTPTSRAFPLENKMQQYIAYVIGKLIIYKGLPKAYEKAQSELPASEKSMIDQMKEMQAAKDKAKAAAGETIHQ